MSNKRHDLTDAEAIKLETIIRAKSSLSSFSAGYAAAMSDVQDKLQAEIEIVGLDASRRLGLDPRSHLLDPTANQIRERKPAPAPAGSSSGNGAPR